MLRVGLGQAADWLSPNTLDRTPLYSVYHAMYETLAYPDPQTGQIQPMLAKSWRVLDDHLTWQFELQEGVRFHNGEEFNAEAVKVTIETLLTERPGSIAVRRLDPATVTRVDVVDNYTVNIVTETPFVLLPAALRDVPMYAPQHLAQVGLEGYAQNPVGSGKWQLKQWDRGIRTVLEKFNDHWGWGGEQYAALVDEIEFRGYPEDATRVAALRAREADIIFNLPPDDAAGIEAEGLNVQWTEIAQSMVLHVIPAEGNPFMDKRVRQAVAYGLDVDSVIENVMLGYGTKLDGQLLGRGIYGYNPDVQAYPYDPDRARELLREAGFADGFSVDFNISQGRYVKQRELNEALAGELARIGINANLNMMEWAVFADSVFVQHTPSPLIMVGWNYFPAMDPDYIFQWWLSTAPYKFFPTAPQAMDEALLNSRQEFDPVARERYLQEYSAIMREEVPVVPLFSVPDIFGVHPRVKGFTPTRDNSIHFWGIHIEE